MRWKSALGAGVAACTAALALTILVNSDVRAADHLDPAGGVVGGDVADIGDLYAWHTGDAVGDTLTLVLTYGGPIAAPDGGPKVGAYEDDVIYGIHISNDGDVATHSDVWIRFAMNDLGDWGVQVLGLPGASGEIQGPIETSLADVGNPNVKVFTGLRDDPFFFDLEGFTDTLNTGALAFVNTRDSFAGQNINAIVLEMPVQSAIGGGSGPLDIWATTARLP